MDAQRMKYIIENQKKWEMEYEENKKRIKRLKYFLGRQFYNSTNRLTREQVLNKLIKHNPDDINNIKANSQGYFYMDYS